MNTYKFLMTHGQNYISCMLLHLNSSEISNGRDFSLGRGMSELHLFVFYLMNIGDTKRPMKTAKTIADKNNFYGKVVLFFQAQVYCRFGRIF